MAPVHSRQLVIDANVARSAGESEHPVSGACRKFLEVVSEVGHRLVMTDAIRTEWQDHQSIFAAVWLGQMTSRQMVVEITGERSEALRRRVDASLFPDQRAAVAKDLHLVEAAMATERLVTSQDKRARRTFAQASEAVSELKQIVWVNPTGTGDSSIAWLRNGAQDERHRRLGA